MVPLFSFPDARRALWLAAALAVLPRCLLAASAPSDPPALSSATLRCDYLEYVSTQSVLVARGRVVMVSSGTRIEADDLRLDNRTRLAHAEGHVYIEDGTMSILAEKADYDWERTTGTLTNAYLADPPWRMWGREIVRVSSESYTARRAAVTNCDLDPPHYHFRGRRARFAPKKRATVYGGALTLDEDPSFYTPVYTRSLRPRRWSLRVDPGRDGRNGYFTKSVFGYPLTTNTYSRIYWDYFQKTGNGWGAEYDYFRPDVKGTFYTYRIKDRRAKTRRWNARAAHWQSLAPRLSLQGNALFQSDQDFNNRFSRNEFERVRRVAESETGLTYQHPLYSGRVSVEQDQVFSPLRDRFVRQHTVLPGLNLQSSPLRLGSGDLYLTLVGNFRNEYTRPLASPPDPDALVPDLDVFRQNADAGAGLAKTVKITRKITLKPSVGLSETWQSWQPDGSTIDRKDLYQGRVFTNTVFRQRVTRDLDYDFSHTYRVRWSPNTIRRDRENPSDQGTEENSLGVFTSYRPGRAFWMRANSGYDLRKLDGEVIQSVRQKIAPPTIETSVWPSRAVSLFYRESFLLHPVRRPQTVQFSAQLGKVNKPRFETGYSYNVATPGQLQLRHGASFPLTQGWWIDGGFQYNARGTGRTRYDSVQFIEKYLIVKRDLHCWQARVEFRQRLDDEEIFLRIDLKTNVESRAEMTSPDEEQFYPARERETVMEE